MSMPYAIDTNYQPAYLTAPNGTGGVTNTTPAEEDVSILTSSSETKTEKLDADYACTDGKEDGRLSTGEKIESVGKGVLKSAVNMIKAPFTEAAKGNFLPAIVAAGGALLGVAALGVFGTGIAAVACTIGGPIAFVGGAIGIAKGIGTIVTGLQKADEIANSGTGTDGEAKAACEQVGSGIFTTGLSIGAVAGGIKSIKGRAKTFAETKGSNMNKLSQKVASGEKVSFREKVKAYTSDSLEPCKFGKLTNRNNKSSTETSEPKPSEPKIEPETKPAQESGIKQDDWQSSRAEVKVGSKSNSNIEPTNKNLTIEQAQKELSNAIKTQQEGINNRTLTKADYKANQKAIEQAQANLDYAKTHSTQPTQPVQAQSQVQQSTDSVSKIQQQANTPLDKAAVKLQSEQDALTRLMNSKPDKYLDPEGYNNWLKDVERCNEFIIKANNNITSLQDQFSDAYFDSSFFDT